MMYWNKILLDPFVSYKENDLLLICSLVSGVDSVKLFCKLHRFGAIGKRLLVWNLVIRFTQNVYYDLIVGFRVVKHFSLVQISLFLSHLCSMSYSLRASLALPFPGIDNPEWMKCRLIAREWIMADLFVTKVMKGRPRSFKFILLLAS